MFEKKDNRDGNPPSLLMGISHILENSKENGNIVSFLTEN